MKEKKERREKSLETTARPRSGLDHQEKGRDLTINIDIGESQVRCKMETLTVTMRLVVRCHRMISTDVRNMINSCDE